MILCLLMPKDQPILIRGNGGPVPGDVVFSFLAFPQSREYCWYEKDVNGDGDPQGLMALKVLVGGKGGRRLRQGTWPGHVRVLPMCSA